MKLKLLTLAFLFAVIPLIGTSQSYYPMVKDSVHWFVATLNNGPPGTYAFIDEFHSNGDTAISSVIYKKIYKRSIQSKYNNYSDPYQPISNYSLFAVLREDTISKRVYSIFFQVPNSACLVGQETLLYDFNMNAGDTVNDSMCIVSSPMFGPIITSKFPTTFDGYNTIQYERFGIYPGFYYEGIGTSTGLFEPESSLNTFALWGYCIGSFDNCGLTNKVIKNSHVSNYTVYPNPVVDAFVIFTNNNYNQHLSLDIFDVNGRCLKHLKRVTINEEIDIKSFDKGIYIIKLYNNQQEAIFFTKIIKS